jgi:hypothetical protein
MSDAESFDNTYNTGVVEQIQAVIVEIDDIQSSNPVVYDGFDNLKRIKIDTDYELEFKDRASSTAIAQQQIASKKAKILNLLDPCRQLAQYTNYHTSRVVR